MTTLLEEGADVNQTNGYALGREAPIHKAARYGHLSILEFLVARGADVHAQDE